MSAQQTTTKLSWQIITVVIFLQIIGVALGIRWFLTHTNVLANYTQWVPSKSLLASPSYDLTAFINFPPAVANDTLNLSAWRGYHGMVTREAFDWSEFSFKFQPGDHGYLYVIFEYTDTTFSAVRMSFNPLYRSAVIRATHAGEFISQEPLSPLPFSQNQWQELSLKRTHQDPSHVSLWLNNAFVTTIDTVPATGDRATKIGFRSGQKPVLVDSVRIWNAEKKLVFTENFDHQQDFWRYFSLIVLGLLAVNRIAFLLLRERPLFLKAYFQFLFVVSFFMICMGSAAVLIENPLRNRYPDFGHWWFKFLKGPTNTANIYLNSKIEWVLERYSIPKSADTKRIMIIGSSQIEGEGISKEGDDVSSQLQKIIDRKLTTPAQKWEVISVGVSGHTAESLLEPFKYQWLKLQPDLVVINLSSNDLVYNQREVPESFITTLEAFAQLSKKHHFTLVFSAEPNSIESVPTLKTHEAMQQVAEKNQVLFLQTHDFMATKIDTGILWWDFVHMTSYGYRLMAEYFYTELEPVLRKL